MRDVMTDLQKLSGPQERREWITQFILERGSVQVDELAGLLQVSRMTIHRDLDDLEHQGVLRKVRNGATVLPSSLFESDIRYRINRERKEKEAIARVAIKYVEPGQAIFVDDATTLLPLVNFFKDIMPLTVITNFRPIIGELVGEKGIQLISLGGEYLSTYDTFTGMLCERAVESLHADLYITSTTATSSGLTFHPDRQIVAVKRTMMRKSSQKFLLLDHTKFGKTALYEVAPIENFDLIVVDSLLDECHLSALQQTGVQLEIAHV